MTENGKDIVRKEPRADERDKQNIALHMVDIAIDCRAFLFYDSL